MQKRLNYCDVSKHFTHLDLDLFAQHADMPGLGEENI